MKHWRRHDHSAQGVNSEGNLHIVVPTACGRFVDARESISNPSETDCSECAEVRDALSEAEWTGNDW